MPHADELIRLEVPADPDSLAVLRTTAAAAGVSLRHDLPIDALDDLRLAIDELAAVVIDSASAGARLDVSFTVDHDVLTVVGHAHTDGSRAPALSAVSTLLLDSVCRRYQVAPRGTFAAEFDLFR